VADWKYVQRYLSEALAKLHFFFVTKKHAVGEVEARITIKGISNPQGERDAVLCQADIELNRKTIRIFASSISRAKRSLACHRRGKMRSL